MLSYYDVVIVLVANVGFVYSSVAFVLAVPPNAKPAV
jgi:hypothetical protein